MKFRNKIIWVLCTGIFIFLFSSCKKDPEESVILLTPSEIILSNIKSQEVITIEVNCISPSELSRLIVSSKLEGEYTRVELDTVISGKNFFMRYEYKVPYLIEGTRILLSFDLTEKSGKIISNARLLDVDVLPKYLTETAGHEIFTKASGKQNGYNLLTGSPVFSHLTDSAKTHISDTSNADLLLKRWVSPAGLKFVRFNGFDYANCSNVSVKNAYASGIKIDFVDNLVQGDIFLTRIGEAASENYAVIKIVSIIDSPGSEWDRIIFNLKK